MASITIRSLDDALKSRLRVHAARHGRSMEAEAREILRAGLMPERSKRLNIADSIRRHIDPLGGVELALPPREPVRQAPKLTK
jgi:plasmid stability protein